MLNMPQLARWWYDLNGVKSVCAEHLFTNEKKWRENYWAYLTNSITTKHENWEHEAEYRLIKYDSFFPVEEYPYKQYRFDDLEGVIFGMKTTESDKRRIIEIIQQKCKSLYEQICDVVNFNYVLDFEVLEQLKLLINNNKEIYQPLIENLRGTNILVSQLDSKVIHDRIAKLLYNLKSFKILGSQKRRMEFNFYQANYCDQEHKIKVYKILTI